MVRKDSLPEFWPSHLAKILSGDQSCRFNVWLKSHYDIQVRKSDFDFKSWKVDHTALLNKRVASLEKQGWTCEVESQNYFKLTGKSAVLPGKPDIIAKKDKKILVVDAKTGKPQDAHAVQVAIYMTAIPMVWSRPNLYMEGEVCYGDHIVTVSKEMAESIAPKLFTLLKDLGSDVIPRAIPSKADCRWCEILESECPDRWKEGQQASAEVAVTDF
jgi:hypothetical protein